MKKNLSLVLLTVVALLVALAAGPVFGSNLTGPADDGGFRALSGEDAAKFRLPTDVTLVQSFSLPKYGLTYNRYQQIFGDKYAEVLGAQLTLYKNSSGETVMVVGAHFDKITTTNSPSRSNGNARDDVARDIGPDGTVKIDLMINPATGRFFHRVETQRLDSRWFHWLDAGNGKVLNKYDGIATDCISDPSSVPADSGCGVKGDIKDMTTGVRTYHGGTGHGATGSHYDLSAPGNYAGTDRLRTYDARNTNGTPWIYYATDQNNIWDDVTLDRRSPGHPALIDAQYYANVTDYYLNTVHGLDWVGDCGYPGMQSIAHYSVKEKGQWVDYSNAFWSGAYLLYGDGDGTNFLEFSGALDVVAHEIGHGVTDCTSDLVYQNESGALNESFSDMMGTSIEFFHGAETTGGVTYSTPDWFLGEDIDTTNNGFRNMADPAAYTWGADLTPFPDHYSERYTGSLDGGGVHINRSITNHWFYLLVEGGSNAGEALGHGHSGPAVTAINQADAEEIAFLGFIGLTSGADMADARDATVAAAETLFGASSQQHDSTMYAWCAVGVGGACGPTDGLPTVSITSPLDGATVSGNVPITADASDDVGVTQVEFFVDGASIGVDTIAPVLFPGIPPP